MKLKRFTATVAATAIAAGVFIAPASAQDSSEDLSSTFANSSDDSVESPDFETNPGFEPGEKAAPLPALPLVTWLWSSAYQLCWPSC